MKQHLAGTRGNVDICKKVPADVQFQIKELLAENIQKANDKKMVNDIGFSFGQGIHEFDGYDIQEIPSQPSASSKGKRKAISDFFKRGVGDSSQPSIKACMQSKDKWHDVDMAIALWFYDACIPMNAANSPFYQIAINKIASMGHGYKGPSYHALRVSLLRDAKQHVKLIIDSYRSTWAETGCTIMGDGWKDGRQRPLITFLVYCPKGISFIKAVDALDIYTNAENLCNLFAEIVEWVRPQNVVHMVIDNATNYKAAGRKLVQKYPHISWSLCATHCINSIMKDIGEMPHVQSLAILASKVTIFIYNHKWTLNWLRKRSEWREIVRPAATRFATTFITLKSLCDHKDDLQALVTNVDFKKFLKLQKGYVYEGMYRARLGIKKLFKNKKRLYEPYVKVIKERWDRMLLQDLHATAYWLNPAFQYDQANFSQKSEVMHGLLNIIDQQNICNKKLLLDETRYFRERELSFLDQWPIVVAKPLDLACMS